MYVIKKRQRQCRMVASQGSKYCGEHLVHDQQVGGYVGTLVFFVASTVET